jgi:ribosomal protein S18 acetylase RimI-like enzyme
MSRLLKIETLPDGREGKIYYNPQLGNVSTGVSTFFLRSYADFIEAGHGSPWMSVGNKSHVIWMEIDGAVVTLGTFDFVPEFKRIFITFASVAPEYRRTGFGSMIYSDVTEDIFRELGATELTALIHTSNDAIKIGLEGLGWSAGHYRMVKNLPPKS